jgi:hypothetical protein
MRCDSHQAAGLSLPYGCFRQAAKQYQRDSIRAYGLRTQVNRLSLNCGARYFSCDMSVKKGKNGAIYSAQAGSAKRTSIREMAGDLEQILEQMISLSLEA